MFLGSRWSMNTEEGCSEELAPSLFPSAALLGHGSRAQHSVFCISPSVHDSYVRANALCWCSTDAHTLGQGCHPLTHSQAALPRCATGLLVSWVFADEDLELEREQFGRNPRSHPVRLLCRVGFWALGHCQEPMPPMLCFPGSDGEGTSG